MVVYGYGEDLVLYRKAALDPWAIDLWTSMDTVNVNVKRNDSYVNVNVNVKPVWGR